MEIISTSQYKKSISIITIMAVPKDFDIYKYISPREEINCKKIKDTVDLLIDSPFFSMSIEIEENKKPNFTVPILLDALEQLGLVVQKIPNYMESYSTILHSLKGKYDIIQFITLNIFSMINDTELIEKYLERAIKLEQS